MSAKNVDKYNRFRSITVAFRVSPEEQKELNRAILNCATKTSFISLLTDKASCFFCFLAIIASSNYPFILICGSSTRKTYIIYFRCKRFC